MGWIIEVRGVEEMGVKMRREWVWAGVRECAMRMRMFHVDYLAFPTYERKEIRCV